MKYFRANFTGLSHWSSKVRNKIYLNSFICKGEYFKTKRVFFVKKGKLVNHLTQNTGKSKTK